MTVTGNLVKVENYYHLPHGKLMHNRCVHKKDSHMLSLLGRLAVSMVLLLGFSVLAAWAWDRSDNVQAHAQLQQEAAAAHTSVDDSQAR